MEIKKKSVGVQGGRGGNGNADCSPSKAQSVVSVSAVVEEGGEKKRVYAAVAPPHKSFSLFTSQ